MKKIGDNLIGRKFERLTVIEPAKPDRLGKRKWLCRCDCGIEKVIYEQSFARGMTKSCGCYNKEASRSRMSRGWAKILTKEFLVTEHKEKKRSLREIGREVGCTIGCIMRYTKKYGIEANDLFYNL